MAAPTATVPPTAPTISTVDKDFEDLQLSDVNTASSSSYENMGELFIFSQLSLSQTQPGMSVQERQDSFALQVAEIFLLVMVRRAIFLRFVAAGIHNHARWSAVALIGLPGVARTYAFFTILDVFDFFL